MIGNIIGDIVGSVYEWNNIKTKDLHFSVQLAAIEKLLFKTVSLRIQYNNGDFKVKSKKNKLHFQGCLFGGV